METGTLWIHLDLFQQPENSPSGREFHLRDSVDRIIESARKEFGPFLESEVSEIDTGYFWKRIFDGEEEGEPLRYFRYGYFQLLDNNLAITDFNFVLPISALGDPEIEGLLEIVDREVRAARIDPFSGDAESLFGPMKRVNFGDQVSFLLPDTFKGRPDDEIESTWYCRFEPDHIEATMWITTGNLKLTDEADGRALEIIEDAFKGILEQILTDENEYRMISRVPGGILAYDIYDEAEIDEIDEFPKNHDWRGRGLYNHLWRYLRFGHGKARIAKILLMLPLERAENAPLPALVKLLDREIRQAEFPGFDEPEAG